MNQENNNVKIEICGQDADAKVAIAGLIYKSFQDLGLPIDWVKENKDIGVMAGQWANRLRLTDASVSIVEKENCSELAPTSNLDFGQALAFLKAGKRLQRAGWNGKGMFVYLVPPASYPVQTGAAKAHFGENAMVPYNAYFAIKNVDNTVSTWVPSVNDCLANDWAIL